MAFSFSPVRYQRVGQTRYGFTTGLLSGLGADWTGTGPTYRRWRCDELSDFYWCALGQWTGFFTQIGLMLLAVVLAMQGHDIIGLVPAILISVNMVAANIIAARLP